MRDEVGFESQVNEFGIYSRGDWEPSKCFKWESRDLICIF